MPEVLVVDDSISVRKALEFSLKPHGLTVHSAPSAEEALSRLAEGLAVDLMIADIVMPGMSGLELCAELRDRPALGTLPVLLMSGVVDDQITSQAQQAGASGLLRKPFTTDDLLPVVQRALQRPADTADVGAEAVGPSEPTGAGVSARLDQLADLPGLLTAVCYREDGTVLEHRGALPAPEAGAYVRFFLGSAGGLGHHLGDTALQTITLDFAGQTLVLARRNTELWTCLLRESSSAGLVKYLLRS